MNSYERLYFKEKMKLFRIKYKQLKAQNNRLTSSNLILIKKLKESNENHIKYINDMIKKENEELKNKTLSDVKKYELNSCTL